MTSKPINQLSNVASVAVVDTAGSTVSSGIRSAIKRPGVLSAAIGAVLIILLVSFGIATVLLLNEGMGWVYGTGQTTLEWGAVRIAIVFVSFLLTALPALMIRFYTEVHYDMLERKIRQDLTLCGYQASEVAVMVSEFEKKSTFTALLPPTIVGVFFLLIGWTIVFSPQGMTGLRRAISSGGVEYVLRPLTVNEDGIGDSWVVDGSGNPILDADGKIVLKPERRVPIETFQAKVFFQFLVKQSSPHTWLFLGAYFYLLGALMRRWLLWDIAAGFLWRLNLRLAIVFVLGLLVTGVLPNAPPNVLSNALPFVLFIGGIIPETFLRYLGVQIASRFMKNEEINQSGLFTRSDLQDKIDGLNFWQADRLLDEGIESVQNLATKQLPDLIVSVRFDTPLLLDWIDQAILHDRAGDYAPQLKSVGIHTATDLVAAVNDEAYQAQGVIDAINTLSQERLQSASDRQDATQHRADQAGNVPARLPLAILKNIVRAIEKGPNIQFIQHYWAHSEPEKLAKLLAAEVSSKETAPGMGQFEAAGD